MSADQGDATLRKTVTTQNAALETCILLLKSVLNEQLTDDILIQELQQLGWLEYIDHIYRVLRVHVWYFYVSLCFYGNAFFLFFFEITYTVIFLVQRIFLVVKRLSCWLTGNTELAEQDSESCHFNGGDDEEISEGARMWLSLEPNSHHIAGRSSETQHFDSSDNGKTQSPTTNLVLAGFIG